MTVKLGSPLHLLTAYLGKIRPKQWFYCLEIHTLFTCISQFLIFLLPFIFLPPFLFLPFLTQNSKVDWVNDPIDLILNQLHSSLWAARTVSTGCGRHLSPLSLPSSGLNFLFLTFNSDCHYLFFSSVFFPPLNLESLPPVIVNKLVFFPPTKS